EKSAKSEKSQRRQRKQRGQGKQRWRRESGEAGKPGGPGKMDAWRGPRPTRVPARRSRGARRIVFDRGRPGGLLPDDFESGRNSGRADFESDRRGANDRGPADRRKRG